MPSAVMRIICAVGPIYRAMLRVMGCVRLVSRPVMRVVVTRRSMMCAMGPIGGSMMGIICPVSCVRGVTRCFYVWVVFLCQYIALQ